MTNQEILTKAIQKAIDGGWEGLASPVSDFGSLEEAIEWHTIVLDKKEVIFNHDFAKALWGEPYFMNRQEFKEAGYRGSMGGGAIDLKKGAGWMYHLQEMVVADDPIAYLGQNMPKGVE